MATQLTAGDAFDALEFMRTKHGDETLAQPLCEIVRRHQHDSGLSLADAVLLRAVEGGLIMEDELERLTPFEIHNRVVAMIEGV